MGPWTYNAAQQYFIYCHFSHSALEIEARSICLLASEEVNNRNAQAQECKV